MGKVGREDACIQGCSVYKNRTKKLDVKISTDNEGRAKCKQICLPQRSAKIYVAESNN